MILTRKFLEQVLPAFMQEVTSEQTELVYEGHHFDAKLDKNAEDELTISIKYKKEDTIREQFEKWCEQIDDDIFVEACEKFEELTGKSLDEAESEQFYGAFQAVVREVVKGKIDALNKKYL